MSKISIPIVPMALGAMFLVLGIGLPADAARADDCVAAPTAAAPQGQHWYYRFDRAKQRKCWYLHAAMRLLHRPPARLDSEAKPAAPIVSATPWPASATPLPASAAPAEAPAPASPSDSTPPPQIKMLNVKTVAAPFAYAATEDAAQQNARQESNVSPPDSAATMTAGRADAADAMGAASPNGEAAAGRNETAQAGAAAGAFAMPKPAEMFFLFAVGLSLVAFLLGIIGKAAARRGNPRISDDPHIAWSRNRFGLRIYDRARAEEQPVRFVDPLERPGLGDLPEPEWIDQPSLAPEEFAPAPPQDWDASSAEPREPNNIELALRVLRQARRQRVA